MKLHEYQAKNLLRRRGVPTLESQVCFTLEEARQAFKDIGFPCVVKAQVHAGGRGKAGGIKLARNFKEAESYAEEILAMTIKTKQTASLGQKVSCVLVEQAAEIEKEFYIGMLIDRETSKICLIASNQGGVEIEEVASSDPESIKKVFIEKSQGLMPYQLRELAIDLGIENRLMKKFISLISGLYQTFVECDASLVEVNPLAVCNGDRMVALDAKIAIDENSLYRQRHISEMRDPTQDDEKEIEAQHYGLSYVALDGNIGCMVNGAGLAMATMDVIKHVGGSPANFLDVGGSATSERVEKAFNIILRDKNVKAIFVNVFGGIAKCDVIAEGIVNAAKALDFKIPLVVRLQGTNVDKGRELLAKSGLKIISANNLLEGASLAVEQVK